MKTLGGWFRPGRWWYLLKKRQKEGWSTPYFRNQVRPRILNSAPVETEQHSTWQIHVTTCHRDHVDLLWTLKSFYHFANRRDHLCIHDDGSLTDEDQTRLAHHFPNARVISRSEADPVLDQVLDDYPRCKWFRYWHPLALKLFDHGHFAEGHPILQLDSDVLFFRRPDELLDRMAEALPTKTAFNQDVQDSLTVTADQARELFDIEVLPRTNTGLLVIRPQVYRWDWLEEFLSWPVVVASKPWRVEQTLLALSAGRDGAEYLSDKYPVLLGPGLEGCVAKHYVGAVRHLLYREGMAYLVRQGFLRELGVE